MSDFTFVTVRLGKDSTQDIRNIEKHPFGLVDGFLINVVCTQVPNELEELPYAFIWLGSDNNKGGTTDWKQGFKAFGKIVKVEKGETYNSISKTAIDIKYIFRKSLNRLDLLREAPWAYYWFSSMPIIGIDDHANQTIRTILKSGETNDIKALFYAFGVWDEKFKDAAITINADFSRLFDFKPKNPKDERNHLDKLISRNKSLQQIYYGAPGTGKSHIIKEQTKGKRVIRTTFHPDSDYSTFVGAYKPTTREVTLRDLSGHVVVENGRPVKEERIVYEFVSQAFLRAYTNAWKAYAAARPGEKPEEQYLVIEEINRGNCAQIFGDLFQLLDRNDSGFSDYPIQADNDMRKQLAKAFAGLQVSQADSINALYDEDDMVAKVLDGEMLILPNNLFIWATMNTSDQSLFPIDSAFKRRWDWKYMPIGNAGKGWRIKADGAGYDWWQFMEKVNDHIGSVTHSEDKKLGYFFCKAKDGWIDAETFVGKVAFYLWNDVFKDYGLDGTLFQSADGGTLTFDKFFGGSTTAVSEGMVAQFLKNLGVDRQELPLEVDESEEHGNEEDEDEHGDGNESGNENEDADGARETSPRDTSPYSVNGGTPLKKANIGAEVMRLFIKDHPRMTAAEIIKQWDSINAGNGRIAIDQAGLNAFKKRTKDPHASKRYKEVTFGNKEHVYVSSQWDTKRVQAFSDELLRLGWPYAISKVEA